MSDVKLDMNCPQSPPTLCSTSESIHIIPVAKELEIFVLSSFDSIRILGAENGIISFNYKDYPSNFISRLLDKHGIASRSGYHCAPLIHDYMNTKSQGAVRISLSYLNKERDLDALYKAMKNELKTI